jgi:ornithine cyclodeaminase
VAGLATKLVSLFPQNAGTARPTHQAVVVVFDPATGEPTALLDGTALTAARTAAASAVSVDLLARPDARVLAILGTGVQARAHADAVVRVRAFDQVRVAGRSPDAARSLAVELGERATAVDGWSAACDGADVVCATTHSPEPVVLRENLAPGTHVTSVGYNVEGREVDEATVAEALVVVESRSTALAPPPAGATELAGYDGAVVELGELGAATAAGRTSPAQLTLYKSVGVAAQDVAAAALVLHAARAAGAGVEVEL